MTYKWISVYDELPPKDGTYAITSNPETMFDLAIADYDGYGFIAFHGAYIQPQFWSYVPTMEKKYGKVL